MENANPSLRAVLQTPGVSARGKLAIAWWMNTRLSRALMRYSSANGALLAGGISYAALFSIGAGLTIAWTVFMRVLGGNETLRLAAIDAINASLPGLVSTPSKDGIINPDSLVVNTGLSVASIIAIVVLVLAAMRVMAALKASTRAMFGIVLVPTNAVVDKLRDFTGFLALALGTILTAALSTATTIFGRDFAQFLGLSGETTVWLTRVASLLIAAVVDAGVFWFLIRVTASVRPPGRDMFYGLVLASIASGALRVAGTSLIGSTAKNPLLASFAALAALLLWVNLLARLYLNACAWIANPPRPAEVNDRLREHAKDRPNYVTLSSPHTLLWPHQSVTGQLDVSPRADATAVHVPNPKWGGLIGAWQRWRLRQHEARAKKLRQSLGLVPAAKVAEKTSVQRANSAIAAQTAARRSRPPQG
ncbi:YihY/virulence factor BrkB family protein [Buchananella hordeovulneris]|uniref:YihY/virulence factor BrkB family protein n=1 Tax=Buchananella hordeovulneris TaxID=52770 RepID=A0A1Q5PZH4_9ACTO|nr:YhjD/YihY/BrkB family envelope integrity protein [Buchananella hordeovulneris]MDO5080760.1 YhjD/YihY/BrkB family envelope integrity protein [Buchananella hordeovulneris]OKL52829.1 hypothetical protein BSZ40_01695 [Buchananella hordeovulneris]